MGTNTCEDNPSQNSDNPSENSDSDLIDQVVDSLDGFGGRRLQQDNYGDWYDPYGVDTDDDYYSDGTGTFYLYADSGYTPEAPEPIGGIPPCYYTDTCEDNPSENSDSDLIDQVVDSLCYYTNTCEDNPSQ